MGSTLLSMSKKDGKEPQQLDEALVDVEQSIELVPEPEDFGFPASPNLQQRECWRNQERFLEAFAHCCRIGEAAETVGLTRSAVERWQRTDVYGFLKRLEAAEGLYVETLEAEIDRRAFKGVDKPVFYKGKQVATVKEYSELLAMFRLKKLRPEYRDSYIIQVPDNTAQQVVDLLKAEVMKLRENSEVIVESSDEEPHNFLNPGNR